jgi:hypothetical protein
MSFLNGAGLALNFAPATAGFNRRLTHAARMQAKAGRSPSRVLVAQALARWREAGGYWADAPVYPEGWPEDFTAQVVWAKG